MRLSFFSGLFVACMLFLLSNGAAAQAQLDVPIDAAGEIPVLVQHLPDWETAQARARYVDALPALKEAVPDQPVLDALPFDGGTEAVTATYEGGARLVIVEYATPQSAFDADAWVNARLAALRG
ncbi:MAG TPA: hypothetical protein VER76_14635, partial [Pyrinomonadaceae bacterium]|nr:hypothetical protein [Pyrinomonadaceae bacterium]